MFTGIIETIGSILSLEKEKSNIHFEIRSSLSRFLKTGQSVSHDGVCLTVTKTGKISHWVTAIHETLERTNLKNWNAGYFVNLERCLKANGRIDGHFVQGHIDVTAKCLEIILSNGSWEFKFNYNSKYFNLLVYKGSVSINGVSLTVAKLTKTSFSVCIIPQTFNFTNFQYIRTGDLINVEFDIFGKYIQKICNKN